MKPLRGIFTLVTGIAGPSGFGSSSTAEQEVQVELGWRQQECWLLGMPMWLLQQGTWRLQMKAKHLILKDNKAASVDVLQLDLNSIKSIRAFVNSFEDLNLPLNLLINNAGVMFCPYQLSNDGIEMQFATNHLGHFLLTNLLLDKMKETAKATGIEGRIVNLSSIAHLHTYEGGIGFENINDRNRSCDRHAATAFKTEKAFSTTMLLNNLTSMGAATTCYVALHPKLKGVTGKYFADCNEFPPSKLATDEILAKKLWDFSNKLVNAAETNH
ncbi:NAD(P)-binding Rossmann-fold superfamily protein [Actinidia rufa]|uniref:NAD(P)-binding Rossmann-fold superfamily protein n=1 Tax=Actinidia rufa TaxID=165716 RepID=A0A7J0F3K4_9ERIC|nr:NAD(P)-binding Rossmann-fold superfamily protein [Actinidia rufa]